MDHLSRISVFIEVVKQGSFVGAARQLGITSSAVSKQIQNLEYELQAKLLNRTTRSVNVTEEGAIFFDRASRAMEDLQEAEEYIHEHKSCPRGTLKVSIPFSVGVKYLGAPIAEFAKKYPEVNLDLSFDDRYVDIAQEGFDLVLRIGALQDSSYIARKLATCPIYVCASPQYLAENGVPEHPDDLQNHNVLAYTRNQGMHEWRYKDAEGREGAVKLNGNFKCDTGEMMREAVIGGVGIAILPIFYIAEPMDSGLVHRVLPEYMSWPERDLHAIFMPNRYLSTRLRLLVDHLTVAARDLPW